MRRGILFAGCLILGLSACKHPDANNDSTMSLSAADVQASGEADSYLQELSAKQAWAQGGKSFTVHRSATCPSDSIDDSGCGNETIYRFVRDTRLLKLSACTCGSEQSQERQLTLTPAQGREIEQLMTHLQDGNAPQAACSAEDANTIWELIVENPEHVEQSYPAVLCKGAAGSTGKVDAKAYQALYEFLRKTLP